MFQRVLEQNLNHSDTNSISNDDKVHRFFETVSNAANESIPIKKGFKPTTPRPYWWNDQCTNAANERRALLAYKNLGNLDNYLTYKNAAAKATKLLKGKQKQCWVEYLSSLNKRTSLTEIWSKVKSISN